MQVDDEAKAELLCFLVMGHLVAIARTGRQLRTDHLIESSVLWLQSHGAECDWLDRAKIVEASRAVARQAFARPYPKDEAGLLKLFNLDAGWFLDYRSPIVQEIHATAVATLAKS
ncbi:hypothetical protein WCQ02_23450 [Paraburkholderia tropica]|uniref:hypothetical protein n=1 Tax=Paraburkholderia tropica TaxID=92647 RepID=UPI003016CA2C